MSSEPLHIFDPRRNFQLQGFTGRGATTTIHDATETGISVSGIFQAAEDFAILGLWNAYDYYAHLRLKHLPRTDLSALKLEFDIEYDHTLDGAMRLDAAKYASVSWDSMCFECGVGGQENIYEVRLLGHATVIGGGETPASVAIPVTGEEPAEGVDWLHLFFRDTRYTVASIDCRVETQLVGGSGTGTVAMTVDSATGFEPGDTIWIERTGTNEEQTTVLSVTGNVITARVTIAHPDRSFVTRKTKAIHAARKLRYVINTAGETAPGRYGPDQTAIIEASVAGSNLVLTFKTAPLPAPRYGKLGNLDRVLVTSGHTDAGEQALDWHAPGSTYRFSGGNNDTRYPIALDFREELRDKLNRVVPMNDCRKMYMVFAPRFELAEAELEDGCFLTADVGPGDTVWQVDDSSKLASGRYFIGTDSEEERAQLLYIDSSTQITVERGYQGSAAGTWAAGARMKRLSPMSGFASDVEWRASISNIAVTGDASLKVGGGSDRIEESDKRCIYSGFWEPYAYGQGWPMQWWSGGHARRSAPSSPEDARSVSIRYSFPRQHDLYLGTFLYTNCGKISVSVDGGAPTVHDLYLNEYGGITANIRLREALAAGNHTVEITAPFDRHPASAGYYFYFDYLWPLEPQDVVRCWSPARTIASRRSRYAAPAPTLRTTHCSKSRPAAS